MYIKDSFFFLSIFEEKFFFFFSTKAQKVFPTKTSTKNAKKKIPAKGCLPDRWERLRMVHTHKDP
jgi:hypothetical protein